MSMNNYGFVRVIDTRKEDAASAFTPSPCIVAIDCRGMVES